MTVRHLNREYKMFRRGFKFLGNLSARFFSSRHAVRPVNHYEVLGVSSRSTHAEIKAAYYKLSKQYHPDVNQNSADAEDQFRKITEAYEILGNLKMRKMYDRGLFPGGGSFNQHSGVENEQGEFSDQSKYKRTRSQPATGRTAIYNFDEWSRFHYGNAINRRNKVKEQYYQQQRNVARDKASKETEYLTLVAVGFVVVLLALNGIVQEDHDKVVTTVKQTKPTTSS